MRTARISDYWRHIRGKKFPTCINSVSINSVVGFEDINFDLNSGINAICGPNGAGKSTLLNLLYESLTCSNTLSDSLKNRIGNASFNINGRKNNTDFNINYTGESGEHEGLQDVYSVNPSSECIQLLNSLSLDSDIDSLLDPVEPQIYKPSDVNWLSYITGRKYDSISCYNIEDMHDKPIIPFFEVTSKGATYSTIEMGLGELCIFFVHWYLSSIANAIVIIEEIESHLSPNSQKALMDCVAQFSDLRSIFFLVSTHSPEIINTIHYESIKLLLPLRFSSELVFPENKDHCLTALGLKLEKKAIIFVEDEGAKWFIEHIFHFMDASRCLEALEFVIVKGEGNIKKALDGLPNEIEALVFMGVYDGDMKAKSSEFSSSWPVLFLPLVEPPDYLLVEKCYAMDVQDLSTVLMRNSHTVERALAACENIDHHDWLEAFSHRIGHDKKSLFNSVFS